jgi:hypothetical protein
MYALLSGRSRAGEWVLDFESHSGNAIGAHYILNVSVTPVGVPVAVVQQV